MSDRQSTAGRRLAPAGKAPGSSTAPAAQMSLFGDMASDSEAVAGMGAGRFRAEAEQAQPAVPPSLPLAIQPMLALLADWQALGWLRRIDLELARFLADSAAPQAEGAEPAEDAALVLLAAALCSWQLGRGHVCLDLQAAIEEPEQALSLPLLAPHADDEAPVVAAPAQLLRRLSLAQWQAACGAAGNWVSQQAETGPADAEETQPATRPPLVLSGPRLYLRRYWQYEQDVQAAILARLQQPGIAADESALRRALDILFVPAPASAAETPAAAAPADGRPDGPSAPQPAGLRAPPTDWQKIACALAARRRFGLITGGPGTGKTTTVLRLLALLQMLAREQGEGQFLRIGLAAPTGKAAARLSSSISGALSKLPLAGADEPEAIRKAIPAAVSTLHRLLGSRPGSRRFRHDARNPLPLDVLVIDEASMVDLEMMALVVQALPPEARLILLGDKDQLASVEAGAILGELCARAQQGHYLPRTAAWVQQVSGETLGTALQDAQGRALDQSVAMLRHSHRFSADSGIGALAEAVNQGAAAAVRALWRRTEAQAGAESDIARLEVAGAARTKLRELVLEGYAHYLAEVAHGVGNSALDGLGSDTLALAAAKPDTRTVVPAPHASESADRPAVDVQQAALDAWAARVLQVHTRFQLLCALRQGLWGVEQLNLQIAQWLQAEGLLPASEGWYSGRPVIVTRNDYELGLMNGDVGIALPVPSGAVGQTRRLRVAFPGVTDPAAIRWVSPSRLQAVETVFAMTVHKAQGSEFDHAVLAMPAEPSPVLTRELVYTAITRARQRFTLCGPEGLEGMFEQAIQRRVRRVSGLMQGSLAELG